MRLTMNRPISLVVAATTLLLGVSWALLTPIFHAPDEAQHYDLISALAGDPSYPDYNSRNVNPTIDALAQQMLSSGGGSRDPHLGGIQPPQLLPRGNLSDRPVGRERATGNQMPQHPPLYYEASAAVLRAIRWVAPGSRAPSIGTEVFLLRLINALVACTIPLAAMSIYRQLTNPARSGVVAALACLMVPQFSHMSGSINNDNLMNLLAAWFTVAAVGITRNGITARSVVLAGLLAGLAAMTKAFGLLLIPILFAVLLISVVRGSRQRHQVYWTAASALLTCLIGGWFWVGNFLAHGRFAPTTFFEIVPNRSPDTTVEHGVWLASAVKVLPERFWLAAGRYAATFPTTIWIALTVAGVCLLASGIIRGSRNARSLETAIALAPFFMTLAYVLGHAHAIYVRTTWFSFLQGRYLFVGLAGLAAVAAMGAPSPRSRLARQCAPFVAVGVQVVAMTIALRVFWGTDHGFDPPAAVRELLIWSPAPQGFASAAAAALLTCTIALALLIRRRNLPDGRVDSMAH